MSLISAIKAEDWALTEALLAARPEDAALSADDWLPLHHAMCNQPPLALVSALLAAHPDAASTPNHTRFFALHLAAANNASLDIVQALLEAYPAAASKEDAYGVLPVEWAMESSPPAAVDVVAVLLAAAAPSDALLGDRLRLVDVACSPGPAAILAALQTAARGRRWHALIAWYRSRVRRSDLGATKSLAM